MNQETFIRAFQESLVGKVSDNIIRENAEYYRGYIQSQISKGKTESEVLEMLGDPRLLAKTIAESQKFSNTNQQSQSDYHSGSSSKQTEYSSQEPVRYQHKKLPIWLIIILVVLVLIVVFRLAFSILRIFAPFIIVGVVIYFAIKVLKSIFEG